MDILQINKPEARIQRSSGLDYWSNLILLLYILTMPFVSAFAYTDIISMPLIFALFLFILMIVKIIQSGKLPEGFLGFDLIIIFLFSFLVLFSFIVNGWGNAKSLNHTAAYLSTFMLFYVGIKFTLFNILDKHLLFKRILQFITYTTLISAVYANVEFISFNAFGVNFNNYVPRPNEAEAWYNPTVLELFYRARGFAPESGHFTFMMELFFPLVVYYLYFSGLCKWKKIFKAICITSIILSFIFAVSTASFVIVPIAFLFASLVYAKRIYFYIKKHLRKFVINTVIISTIVLISNYLFSFYSLVFLSIMDKMNSFSYDDRQDRINFFYNNFYHLDFLKKLYGSGPAGSILMGFDETRSILSLYYSVTFELGFLGLLCILLFFSYNLLNALKIKTKLGFFLLISIISGVLHFHFIANFWYPWFWFIAAFTIFCTNRFAYE
jgi:hypothetical protein